MGVARQEDWFEVSSFTFHEMPGVPQTSYLKAES